MIAWVHRRDNDTYRISEDRLSDNDVRVDLACATFQAMKKHPIHFQLQMENTYKTGREG